MIWMSYLWEELGIFSRSHCSSLCLNILQLWSSRVNFTFHERLPYCNCDLCKCHHGFSLNVKKSDAIRKPAAVYVPLKKWDWLWSTSLVRNSESSSPPIPLNFLLSLAPFRGLRTILQGNTRSWSWNPLGMEGLSPDTNKQTDQQKQTDLQKQTDIRRQTDISGHRDRPADLCLKWGWQ